MVTWKKFKDARDSVEAGDGYRKARLSYEFGCRVRELREARSMSQQELASKMSTSQSTIARLEAGGVDPKLSTVRRVAEVFGIPITVFEDRIVADVA
jgi:transcriptional regulator with XRE-family HTH domain